MRKYNRIMEIFWMVVAILTLLYGVYRIGSDGFEAAGLYLIMPFAAATLSYLRYYMRKRMEKEEQE